MEECYENGLAKSIGLSNFNSEQIKRVLDNSKTVPVMLQVIIAYQNSILVNSLKKLLEEQFLEKELISKKLISVA